MESGGLKCWGDNTFSQVGDGELGDRSTPVDVCAPKGCGSHLSGVTDVALGFLHTCAAFVDGSAQCWGRGTHGRLGDGEAIDRPSPVTVCADEACAAPLAGVVEIAAGQRHTCALLVGGGAKCWGWNGTGQLGDDSDDDRFTPVDVLALAGATQIETGVAHTCAQTNGAGAAWCWGSNGYGSLGTGGSETASHVPVQPLGLDSGVVRITAGNANACAATAAGSLVCWGYNQFGQAGDGTMEDRPASVGVTGLSPKGGPTPTPSPAASPTPDQTAGSGDVDCSGTANTIDAALLLQLTALLIYALDCPAAADVDGSGAVTSVDAALILQFAAGLIDELPI
jgi:hypothetical protein